VKQKRVEEGDSPVFERQSSEPVRNNKLVLVARMQRANELKNKSVMLDQMGSFLTPNLHSEVQDAKCNFDLSEDTEEEGAGKEGM
jgi:hypothetical protein